MGINTSFLHQYRDIISIVIAFVVQWKTTQHFTSSTDRMHTIIQLLIQDYQKLMVTIHLGFKIGNNYNIKLNINVIENSCKLKLVCIFED